MNFCAKGFRLCLFEEKKTKTWNAFISNLTQVYLLLNTCEVELITSAGGGVKNES